MDKRKTSPLRNIRKSFMFRLVRGKLTFLGLNWVEDDKEPTGGYWTADMPETRVQWKVKVTKRYFIYKPLSKIPGIKHIHYTYPYLLGIWLHRTVVWDDGHKTRDRLVGRAKYLANKNDIAHDYVEFLEKIKIKE